jgi:HAD superfamily hydrolase (TIGR01509 family)
MEAQVTAQCDCGCGACSQPPEDGFDGRFGVIFDNDGVLVDSEPFSLEAYRRGIEEQGLKLTNDDLERNTGLTDADIVRDLEQVYGAKLDPELFAARKVVIYRDLVESGQLHAFPGVRELVTALRAEGIPYVLASSGSQEKIAFNLRHAGISDLFPTVISGEDFHRGKPDPEIVICSAAKLGLEPCQCAVIEDSINGLKAARAAGSFAVGITNTFSAAKIAPYADVVIASMAELTIEGLRNAVAAHAS